MAGLRDDGLLISAGEAMIPDLFHESLTVSRRRAVALAALRWDPDLSPRVVGLSSQEWEDDHNEEEQAYP